ncbi:MAG: S1 RNA-binding domain-containing protein [Chloroflexi bacterium]|nr:S1 RNA-binding domain-containing protein [Chloroflexota bacterium]
MFDPNTSVSPESSEEDENFDFSQLLDAYDYAAPSRGDILTGTILEITPENILLDVGLKRDAIVPRRDLERLEPAERSALENGADIKVYVIDPQNSDGELVVSISKALAMKDWERAEELMESADMLACAVIDSNKGGVLVAFGNLRGFVPQSQLVSIPRGASDRNRKTAMDDLIGHELSLKVIEVNQRRNRLVLSERAAHAEMRTKRLHELEVGQEVEGVVVNLKPYGAFVDIDGIDGLIHISELDWQHVNHPREVVNVGDHVKVQIESVDVERERIGLSRRAVLPNPWDSVEESFPVNALTTGKVSSVADFGIFLELSNGVVGLLHISQMSSYRPNHPSEVAVEGDELLVRVIGVDKERQRISLSLDRVSSEEQLEWMAERAQDVPSLDEIDIDEDFIPAADDGEALEEADF